MASKLQNITVNFGGKIRYGQIHGRTHIIAPVAMMATGVWAGSDGPLLYTSKHLNNSCPAWNNKPVVIRHPKNHEGRPVSAGDPDILNRVEVGRVLNARYERGKQRAEAWLDEALLKKTAPDIHQRILNNEIIEVSTGLFVDQKPRPGTFNGKSYDAVATNHRPDHLAILPDEEGACSVRDGAGLLQIHSKGKTQMKINKKVVVDEIIANGCFAEEDRPWLLTANETQLGSLLAPLINEDEDEDEDDFEIEDEDLSDVEDSDDEYEDDDSDDVDEDELENNSKGKKKKIAGAQDNSTGAAPMFKKGKGGKTPKGGIPTMCQSMESYIAGLPPEAQEIFRIGQQTLNNKKQALIGAITSNSGNPFPKRQLAQMEIEELEALASLSTNGGQQDGTGRRFAPIYDGAAGGAFAINSAGGDKLQAMTMPTINFKDGEE